ncbi:MAG: sugar transferase [Desulfomonile tiedjei]|nr:sugar transferase [Desulfomonile tiedjei]
MFRHYHRFKLMLMAADVVFTVGLLAALTQYGGSLPRIAGRTDSAAPEWFVFLLVGLLWHALFAMMGVYELRKIPDFASQAGSLTSSHALAVLMLTGFFYFTLIEVPRSIVVCFAVADYLALLLPRYFLSLYLKHGQLGADRERVLIVGTSESGLSMAQTIIDKQVPVLKLIGFADNVPPEGRRLSAPVIGGIEDVPRLVQEYSVAVVILAFPENRGIEARSAIERLESLPVRIYILPDVLSLAFAQSEVERIGDLVVIGVREPLIQGHRRVAKRIMDVTLSLLGLVIAWPLFLLIWIAIRLDSPGPVIFVAKRVGLNGKIFDLYKFRTMTAGTENAQADAAKAPTTTKEEACRVVYKTKDDPRITHVGRWLRKTSLDELPQLFNVIKGDMSLVGPRPEQPFLTECYDHWEWQRLLVPPGVTGWWQVSGRGDLPMHLNAQYDIYYVRNYSVWLDLKILFKTIGAVLKGKGAY